MYNDLKNERVLSLDISSKTGWSFTISSPEGITLEAYGQIPPIHEPTSEPYPGSYVLWANQIFSHIVRLIDQHAPDILVIEETVAGSKNVYSHKILEFSQYLLARLIRDTGIKCRYFLTGEWRQIIGCVMTKEEKIRNKAVRDYKAKTGKALARDANNKVMGKVGKKHVNVRRANEIFGEFLNKPLLKKDEDVADSLGLAAAYHFERMKKNV